MLRFPLLILLVLCVTASFAQSKRKRSKKEETSQQPSSMSPYFPSEDYEPEKKKSKKSKHSKGKRNMRKESDVRKAEFAKAYRKAERDAQKPQFSDPSYFGHKHKPKKRPPGKMKFCKVCEIRH